MIYNVREGQGTSDVTIQEFGDLEYLFTILSDNQLSINDKLDGNISIIINNENVGNEIVKNEIIRNGFKFANQIKQTEYLGYKMEGEEGYIVDENGFKILIG